jgi:hypothetical protein
VRKAANAPRYGYDFDRSTIPKEIFHYMKHKCIPPLFAFASLWLLASHTASFAQECDTWVFDHHDTQQTVVCVEFVPSADVDCWVQSYMVDIYTCFEFPPIDPPPGGDPPSSPPAPPPNPKDLNRDGIMDCWTANLDSTHPSKDVLDPTQTLGADYGGTNSTSPHHTGIDEDCNLGDTVYSTHNGKVVMAQDVGGQAGIVVKVQNDNGSYSAFAHLQRFSVVSGARVGVGTPIGNCNASGTGGEQGDHLHYEVQCPNAGNCFVDPVAVHPCQSQP